MSRWKSDTLLWDVPVAFVLLTRLPIPALPEHAFARGARAVWAYPLVGAVLGLIAVVLMALLSALGVEQIIAAGLGLAGVVMLTGAMHEDGLADTVDGLWGGFSPARRLEIMKDSRIGTYGVLALVLTIGLRWAGYAHVSLGALVAALVISRAAMPVLMAALPHARQDGLSQSVGRPDWPQVVASIGVAVAISYALIGPLALFAMMIAGPVTCVVALVARAKVGGQTGDILGACQNLCEIAVLIGFAAL
ncbi:MAG: adenosylcobinamide-GDP ribazoletransferase [Pseudomonadota bacterium]